MEKKKLLFVYYKLWKPGGIARVLTNLANELVEDYDVTILILVDDKTTFYDLDKRVKLIGINTYAHWAFTKGCVGINKYANWLPKKQNIKKYLYDFGASQILGKWLDENHHKYDLLIPCQYKLSVQFASNTKVRNKTIAWEHTGHEVGGRFFDKLRKKQYKNLKAIVAINKASNLYYKDLNPNTFLIPNIIGEPFESMSFFENKENLISFVGRLDKDKNVMELVKIIKETDLSSRWKVQIIGDGPERNNLETFVNKSGLTDRISFLGNQPIEEVSKLLQSSKIFASTSLREAFAMVLVESMMSGNALIAYDCNYGPSDIINEKNGFLIPMHNKNEFIEKLEFLTKNENELEKLMSSSFKESKYWGKAINIKRWKEIFQE